MSGATVNSVEEMMALGHQYAAKAKGGDVFGLVGTLGTGKTHWTKGFMGFIQPGATVSSPTFAIVNEYRADSTRSSTSISTVLRKRMSCSPSDGTNTSTRGR